MSGPQQIVLDTEVCGYPDWDGIARVIEHGHSDCGASLCCFRMVAQQIREQATPKPEEPTDPKARVEDRRDNIWRLLADGDWVCTSGPDIGEYLVWDRLASERGPLTVEVNP